MKGLRRPKENTGKEEDFQKWSKKREAFFAGVIQESEMMLEWSNEQAAGFMTELTICRLRRIRNEEHKTWSSCCSRCTQHSWLSRVMGQMTLSPTRGRTRWRHVEECRNDMTRRQEEESGNCFARSFLMDGALFWNFKRRSAVGNPTCRALRKS